MASKEASFSSREQKKPTESRVDRAVRVTLLRGWRAIRALSSCSLRLVTPCVCAVSRLMRSPVQLGRTERKVLGAPDLPEIERWRGKEPVMESGGQQKTCTLRCRKLRVLWRELDCPKPNREGSRCPP